MSESTMMLTEEQEYDDMGSFNHSLVQGNLAYSIRAHSDYSAFIELSLDASRLDKMQFPNVKGELIPDVAVYPRQTVVVRDILIMQEMPKLVIEVISPRQGSLSIIEKFDAYFALGIPSCWLVDPVTAVIMVYHPNKTPQTFSSGNVIDPITGIEISLNEVFW